MPFGVNDVWLVKRKTWGGGACHKGSEANGDDFRVTKWKDRGTGTKERQNKSQHNAEEGNMQPSEK